MLELLSNRSGQVLGIQQMRRSPAEHGVRFRKFLLDCTPLTGANLCPLPHLPIKAFCEVPVHCEKWGSSLIASQTLPRGSSKEDHTTSRKPKGLPELQQAWRRWPSNSWAVSITLCTVHREQDVFKFSETPRKLWIQVLKSSRPRQGEVVVCGLKARSSHAQSSVLHPPAVCTVSAITAWEATASWAVRFGITRLERSVCRIKDSLPFSDLLHNHWQVTLHL